MWEHTKMELITKYKGTEKKRRTFKANMDRYNEKSRDIVIRKYYENCKKKYINNNKEVSYKKSLLEQDQSPCKGGKKISATRINKRSQNRKDFHKEITIELFKKFSIKKVLSLESKENITKLPKPKFKYKPTQFELAKMILNSIG